MHFFCIDISHHNEGEIVRHVTRLVILHHLLLRELVVNFHLADHWQPIRMTLVGGRKQQQTRLAIRIVKPHREFATNDFLFFRVFFRRQSRIHHRVGQNRERGRHSVFRHVDPKDGPIERSISVDVTAHVLDFLRDRVARLRFGPFEEHVLEDVREPRAQFLVLVNAAGVAPGLHTCHRRASVFLHNQRQAVGQNPFLRRARRKSDDHTRAILVLLGLPMGFPRTRTINRSSFQVRHAKYNCRK